MSNPDWLVSTLVFNSCTDELLVERQKRGDHGFAMPPHDVVISGEQKLFITVIQACECADV